MLINQSHPFDYELLDKNQEAQTRNCSLSVIPDKVGFWWFQDDRTTLAKPVFVWRRYKDTEPVSSETLFEHPETKQDSYAKNFPNSWFGYCKYPDSCLFT